MNRSAFTLIELLVVIAIIAILAAILFPVFATAREKARQTTCASNEKQLGLAIIQYVQDYDEMYPGTDKTAKDGNGAAGFGYGWAGDIYPYVKSIGAFACPDDTDNPGNYSLESYALNEAITYNATLAPTPGSLNMGALAQAAKLVSPTMTVMLFEIQKDTDGYCLGNANFPTDVTVPSLAGYSPAGFGVASVAINGGTGLTDGSWTIGCAFATGPTYGQTAGVLPAGAGTTRDSFPVNQPGRHTGGSNWLLADGHVKYLRANLVSGGVSAALSTDIPTGIRAAGTSGQLFAGGPAPAATFSTN